MAAILKVRKELLSSEIHYGANNTSYKVDLAKATQAELTVLRELGFDIFEKPEDKVK